MNGVSEVALSDYTLVYWQPQPDVAPVLVMVQEDLDKDEVLVEGVFSGGMWRVPRDELYPVQKPWPGLVLDYDLERWRV